VGAGKRFSIDMNALRAKVAAQTANPYHEAMDLF
jgi:hypothetical protein